MKSTAFPTLDGLVDLACRDGVDVRPTLLRVLTDLYVQKPTHSSDEVTQYVELALGLIATVDDATRTAVAASLAGYPAAPAAILAKLGFAATTAVHATLPEVDYAAGAVEAQDAETDSLVDLFFTSSSEDRRLILLNLDAAATTSVRLPAPASADVFQQLETAALQRNIVQFGRTLARTLRIPRDLAERVARDPSGEPIVVAAKSLGMKAAVLQRILLFVNPSVGQSVQRVYDLADLFDALPREAAERMLTIWRSAGDAAAPEHEPVYRDSTSRQARPGATVREAAIPEQQPARHKSSR
ncbi:MAG: DUF2336 domain-containing protein [Hyphomicrobium sp.]|nr:DUF2336 domain-containing protein [Hyphomicrobium sp.]